MKYKNIDLRKSTILDIEDSQDIRDEFGIDDSKEIYNQKISIETRIKDFLDYAELKNDNDLSDAVHNTFKSELSLFGFE